MASGALHATRRDGEAAAPAFRAGSVPVQRAELRVSSVHDAAEREAGDAARRVMQMPAPRIAAAAPVLARSPVRVQRAGEGVPRAGGDTAARIQARKSGGQPLPAPLRRFMEPRFNADFSAVRVHADEEAARLSQRLAARAFTTGAHVFFGRGQYQPETAAGRELIAHELAHTIQQGAAPQATVQRSEAPASMPQSAPALTPQSGGIVQRLGLSDILDGLAALAANVPGYTLLTLIIGRNPINMRAVERSFVNVLRAFIGLIPGGEILFQVLQRYCVVDRLGAWVNDQTAALGLNFQTVRDAFTRFTDSLSWTDIFHPSDVWNRARSIFTPLIARITAFVSGLVSQAVTWLKETFMEPLAGFCREIPGYGLVTVMLGRDPFTNAPVPRTALTVVRAFAEFIPGGTEKVDQLVQSGALDRAYAWFQQETGARNLTWARVTGTFAEAWASLHLEDVLHPIDTLRRIVGLFTPLLADLVSFAGAALLKLLELIYEAAMGAGGRRILAILTRARATFVIIINNPVGFLRNLMGAVAQGVRQFMNNILAHLRDGVIAWLTGPVAAAGVQMPERWDLRGIIWFVLQILGLTWARVREKLVRLIGAPAMGLLERGFALLQEIREKGLVQALRDRVSEFFGNLRDSALGAIRNFIQQRLVMAGITQLLSMLNPVGAIIQAIIKTYTTIQFFIQKINQILDLVESIVNSIAAIASGAIGAAANFVERTMARTIPVILDFLARFIGLGDVGAQVQTTIRNLQGAVDRMLDRAVEWIRTQAQRVGSAVAGGARRVAARISNWWSGRRSFTARDRTAHALYFQGEGARATLTVSTVPTPVDAFLARVAPLIGASTDQAAKNDLAAAQTLFNGTLRARLRSLNAPGAAAPSAADVDRINQDLITLSNLLVSLIPFDSPSSAATAIPTSLPVSTDQLFRLITSNQIAVVISVANATIPGGARAAGEVHQMLNWKILRPRGRSGAGGARVVDFVRDWGRLYEMYVDDPRELYLGPTPDRSDAVGQRVKQRMQSQGKYDPATGTIRYNRDARGRPLASGQQWQVVPESNCDMGHLVDAVVWWNSNGRLTFPQSPEVLRFMSDPDNYELEPSGPNRARGASLGGSGVRYRPPVG